MNNPHLIQPSHTGYIEMTLPVPFVEVVGGLLQAINMEQGAELIMDIDEWAGDEGFTFGIIERLLKSLLDDYEGQCEHYSRAMMDELTEKKEGEKFHYTPAELDKYMGAAGKISLCLELVSDLKSAEV
jgi:hypothetical protein